MAFTCKDCGQKFLSSSEYKHHEQTHLQTHLDKWSKSGNQASWKPPEGMSPALFKVFEEYRLGEKAMLCLWYKGQLNTAIREPSRILELQDRLKEWLSEARTTH
jgi:hypothetical protein